MRNLTLPGINIIEERGYYFLIEKSGEMKELDGGYVNTLLEKIANMNCDETLKYIADNIKGMKFLRRKKGFYQRYETIETYTE